MACGLLIIVGVVLLRGYWPRRALTRAGNVLLVTSGAGLIIVGLFPEDDAFLVHAVAAVVQIPAQGVALLLLGIGLVSSRRGLAVWTLACAAIALAGTVIFFSPLSGAVGYRLARASPAGAVHGLAGVHRGNPSRLGAPRPGLGTIGAVVVRG